MDRSYGLLLAVLLGLAALAAVTTPFTWAANFVVIAGFVAVLGLWLGQAVARSPVAAISRRPRTNTSAPLWHWAPLEATMATATGWELYCYFSSPRSEHPTISSIFDMVDANHAGHGLMFAAWLLLGWYLVTR